MGSCVCVWHETSESSVFHWFYKVFRTAWGQYEKGDSLKGMIPNVWEASISTLAVTWFSQDPRIRSSSEAMQIDANLEHGTPKSYVFHWFYKVFRDALGHHENLRLRDVLAWF